MKVVRRDKRLVLALMGSLPPHTALLSLSAQQPLCRQKATQRGAHVVKLNSFPRTQ